MEEVLKQNKDKSHEEFERLLAEDLEKRKFKEGEITTGTVEEVGKKFVFIDLGLKSSGAIPLSEFQLTKELDKIKPGTQLEILLERIENKNGEIVISREKAQRAKSWNKIIEKYNNKEQIQAQILQRTKGGFICEYNSVLCFLPSSQLDLRPLKDVSHLMKTPLTFEIVKVDRKRGNIVLSRKEVIQKIRDKDREKILSTIKEGSTVQGVVKNLTDWGAFIDLQGVDGLIHITDISWARINKPSDLLSVGQTVKVLVTKIDPDTKKISCSIKGLTENPWLNKIDKYKVGEKYEGTVSKVMEYGCFIKLDDSVEGLVHQSQLSWTKKNIHPGKILSTSQKVTVELLEIDKEKQRLSLSYRNCFENPWSSFAKNTKIGDTLSGTVKNVTDYGLFISINDKNGNPTELDGLCHYKDLDFSEKESELEKYKKNQKVEFKLLEVNNELEKIRLGIKQLVDDPFDFFKDKKVSSVVTGVVESATKNGIYVNLGKKSLSFLIKRNQLAKDVENQRIERFVPGQKVDCMISELQHDKRKVALSIKALEEKDAKEAVKKYGSTDSGQVLGDILGPLLGKKKKKKK